MIVGVVEVTGGTISNADRVVSGMRAGFRACHERGIATDPHQRGAMQFIADVGPNGEVLRARVEGGVDISKETLDCMIRRVQSATFAPPEGANATVSFPVTLEEMEVGVIYK